MVFEEAPSSDRRSIPPISRPSPKQASDGKGWLPILAAGFVATVVLAATHAPRASSGHAAAFPDIEKPRPILVTEAARRPSAVSDPDPALAPSGVVIRGSAIVRVHGAPTVFVQEADYRFVATPVVLGRADADGQQVLSGIRVGQVVVTDGAEALKAHLTVQ